MDSIIIRYEDNELVRYDGKVRREKRERDWSGTDQSECHGEDEVARLEGRGY